MEHQPQSSPGSNDWTSGCCVVWKCFVACLLGELSQQPTHLAKGDPTAYGVPAMLVMPANSSTERILPHSHSGGSVTASMDDDRGLPVDHRVQNVASDMAITISPPPIRAVR